uniref:B9 domain-containing protein 2 n=1 Tax=Palpitomonas bilix TaxID=652834 RepID=A0A7S3DEX6_9EUKA|mmetsp:Transcript_34262/g.88528  ORF Transcript_34262/g.88528 Transcript_34262/m.88528 type:complete len:171 (+) Transcript_34262:284-796(+)
MDFFLRYGIVTGDRRDEPSRWRLLGGEESGQSHAVFPDVDDVHAICQPIDVHYAVSSIQGWPKIFVQVWGQSHDGTNDLQGYGFVSVPMASGSYDLSIRTWRPIGSFRDEITSVLVGGHPQVTAEEIIYNDDDRFRLKTESTGEIIIHLEILHKDFERRGIVFNENVPLF